MSTAIDRQLRQIQRFGVLARYIDSHLDDALTLVQLADVASLSQHRLDSSFHAYAQETPMSRVWRLRLLRARQQISAQTERPLLDIALDAGYGSAQAFSRAFRRLHGQAPSAFRQQPPINRPGLRIEALPAMAIQYIPYTGSRADLSQASNELRARAMACSIERHKRFGWAVNVQANLYPACEDSRIDVQAALLHEPLGHRIPGLDEGRLAGGTYAVFSFQSGIKIPAASVLMARVEQETGWRVKEGAWLRRCRNAQYLPSFLESRFELYLPVRPEHGTQPLRAQAFILEK